MSHVDPDLTSICHVFVLPNILTVTYVMNIVTCKYLYLLLAIVLTIIMLMSIICSDSLMATHSSLNDIVYSCRAVKLVSMPNKHFSLNVQLSSKACVYA